MGNHDNKVIFLYLEFVKVDMPEIKVEVYKSKIYMNKLYKLKLTNYLFKIEESRPTLHDQPK